MDSANSVMTLLVRNCRRTMINVPTEAQNKYAHWETDLPTNNTIKQIIRVKIIEITFEKPVAWLTENVLHHYYKTYFYGLQ